MSMESEEFKLMSDKALQQLMSGQSLTGKDGVFAPRWRGFVIRGVRKKFKNVQIGVADFAILAENQTGIATTLFYNKLNNQFVQFNRNAPYCSFITYFINPFIE